MLLLLSAVLYILALFFSIMSYSTNLSKRVPQVVLATAVTSYFVGVSVRAIVTQSFPFSDVYGFYSLLGNFIVIFLVAFSFLNAQVMRFYLFISFSGFLLTLLGMPSEPSPYKNALFALHVVCAAVGYASVFFGSLSSSLKIVLEGRLKSKNLSGFFLPISTLASSEKMFLNLAFVMLTLTLIFGSLWARSFFGRHWVSDPKLISTLFIWIYYAVVVHLNLLNTLKPKRLSQLNIVGGSFALLNLALIRHEL